MRSVRLGTMAVAIVPLLALFPRPACAHDAPYSFLNLRFAPGRASGTLTAHIVDLAHEGGGVPDSLLAPARARAAAPRLWAILARRLAIVADGDTLQPVFVSAVPDSERKGIAFAFVAPTSGTPADVAIEARFFPYDPQHETYVNVYVADSLRQQDLLDARHPRVAFATGAAPSTGAVVRRFIASGIHHIFIGPDHILFVVGLLLLGGSLGRLLKIVTGFTIAHSITLALATLGLFQPPARVIEPLIALSIVFVGLENLGVLRGRSGGPPRDRRALLAFVFGFVHGFGFASVLREFGLPAQAMGWALFAFNVGVECGQAAIVLATAPALAFLRAQNPAWGLRAAAFGSIVVVAAGGYWFVQRVLAG
jgi:hypothetical protein